MKRFGLVGHPLGHSLSPVIHRRILEIAGIDGTYTLHDIDPADVPRALPALLASHDGLNCTIPHKQAVIPFLRELDPSAAACGAVNTIHGGRGYNTDTEGFLACGVALRNRDALILGAGGSARMMAAACVAQGARSITSLKNKLPRVAMQAISQHRNSRFQSEGLLVSAVTVFPAGGALRVPRSRRATAYPSGVWYSKIEASCARIRSVL